MADPSLPHQEILLEAYIIRRHTGGIALKVNGKVFNFDTLSEAYWMLREAADQRRRELADQKR